MLWTVTNCLLTKPMDLFILSVNSSFSPVCIRSNDSSSATTRANASSVKIFSIIRLFVNDADFLVTVRQLNIK